MIFNIQKCSIHDGIGLRTLVFFKGCPLKCKWCANPESQSYEPEIMESQAKCIGCGTCVKVCPQSAISMADDGFRIDRSKCIKCNKCADNCNAESKYLVGKEYSIEELFEQIDKDRVFYSIKGGGVTFSGGEPLTFPEYLTQIAKMCHERRVDVAIESCGYGDYDKFKAALPFINSIFLDIKHMDPEIHRKLTGKGNELILDNIRRIANNNINITIRTPIIPGINSSKENISEIAKFICSLPGTIEYELLPYHKFGVNKYKALGREYELPDIEPPEDSEMCELVKCANTIFSGTNNVCFYTKNNKKVILK